MENCVFCQFEGSRRNAGDGARGRTLRVAPEVGTRCGGRWEERHRRVIREGKVQEWRSGGRCGDEELGREAFGGDLD